MATAKLYCTFGLLLYLQGNYAQQAGNSNQNTGINNGIGLSQPAPLRPNKSSNINQIPSGGLNVNLPQQTNLQQSNPLQAISANLQTNLQQSSSLPANIQPHGPAVTLTNLQIAKQGLPQLPTGFVGNPSKSQTSTTQFNNPGCRQNSQIPQQNLASMTNVPSPPTQNLPFSSNALAEIAALKGQPSLLSLFANQNFGQPQQNQQMASQNYNSGQNQLTDAQKQFLVRALQSAQSSGQNQAGLNFIQSQLRAATNNNNNQPIITVQSQPVPSQLSQPIVTTIGNPPPYITVQAQPLTTYLQNQSPQIPVQMDEQAMPSLMLSELNQPHETDYNVYPYQVQKKNSKSNLKSLIPLIINLLKEKSSCGCQNCGCPTNGCGNNNVQEPSIPAIFSGYSNQKNYSQTNEGALVKKDTEEPKSKSNVKEQKNSKNVKKNTVKVDSEESEEENDSEYEDSEGD